MKNPHQQLATTVGIFYILGILGGVMLAGCGRKEVATAPPVMTEAVAPSEKINTSGTAPNLYTTCWRGLMFMSTSVQGGVIQVLDTTGKPMECK